MTKHDKLYEFADELGVLIDYDEFSHTKKAVCLHSAFYKAIIVDKNKITSTNEEAAVLAEELGHYATSSLYFIESLHNTPTWRTSRRKYEKAAKKWAIKQLLPPDDIREGIRLHGVFGLEAVADFCETTVEFLSEAIEYYKCKEINFELNNQS